MEKRNPNQNTFNSNIEMFRFIVFGYLKNNYSYKFYKNLEYHIVNSSMSEYKCISIVILRGCGEFKLEIDIKSKTIKHIGDYQKNRSYPVGIIIEKAINKYCNHEFIPQSNRG